MNKIALTKEELVSKCGCDVCSTSALEKVNEESQFLYRFRRYSLEFSNGNIELKNSGIILSGKTASVHLDGSTDCIMLVGTLGEQVDRVINKLSVKSISEAYTADCAANLLIEKYLDALCETLEEELQNREKLSNRFSPGYGDLPLDLQPKILCALDAEKIGVTVNDQLLMHPLKTVTAFIGVGINAKKIPYSCADCSRYPDCDKRLCYVKL